MSWSSEAVCRACWDERMPGIEPHALLWGVREIEQCCYCGRSTIDGIYMRVDTRDAPYANRVGK